MNFPTNSSICCFGILFLILMPCCWDIQAVDSAPTNLDETGRVSPIGERRKTKFKRLDDIMANEDIQQMMKGQQQKQQENIDNKVQKHIRKNIKGTAEQQSSIMDNDYYSYGSFAPCAICKKNTIYLHQPLCSKCFSLSEAKIDNGNGRSVVGVDTAALHSSSIIKSISTSPMINPLSLAKKPNYDFSTTSQFSSSLSPSRNIGARSADYMSTAGTVFDRKSNSNNAGDGNNRKGENFNGKIEDYHNVEFDKTEHVRAKDDNVGSIATAFPAEESDDSDDDQEKCVKIIDKESKNFKEELKDFYTQNSFVCLRRSTYVCRRSKEYRRRVPGQPHCPVRGRYDKETGCFYINGTHNHLSQPREGDWSAAEGFNDEDYIADEEDSVEDDDALFVHSSAATSTSSKNASSNASKKRRIQWPPPRQQLHAPSPRSDDTPTHSPLPIRPTNYGFLLGQSSSSIALPRNSAGFSSVGGISLSRKH